MNKKAKRIKIRRSWGMSPVTRVKKSKKIYSRKRVKEDLKCEIEVLGTSKV